MSDASDPESSVPGAGSASGVGQKGSGRLVSRDVKGSHRAIVGIIQFSFGLLVAVFSLDVAKAAWGLLSSGGDFPPLDGLLGFLLVVVGFASMVMGITRVCRS